MSAVVKPSTVAFDAALICAVVGLDRDGHDHGRRRRRCRSSRTSRCSTSCAISAPSALGLAGLALVVSLPTELWYRLNWLLLDRRRWACSCSCSCRRSATP